jgi:predicted 2-oxoglutarate/Fe(II)-dependent dioxygenase YbiX
VQIEPDSMRRSISQAVRDSEGFLSLGVQSKWTSRNLWPDFKTAVEASFPIVGAWLALHFKHTVCNTGRHPPAWRRLVIANLMLPSRRSVFHFVISICFPFRDFNLFSRAFKTWTPTTRTYRVIPPVLYATAPAPGARVLEDALLDNEAEHARECRRSEKLFYYSSTDGRVLNDTQESSRILPEKEWKPFSFDKKKKDSIIIDDVPPHLFTHDDLARTSLEPLFSAEDCAAIIQEAEHVARWRNAQSLAAYARNASTFVSVGNLPKASSWLDGALARVLYPAIESVFPREELYFSVPYLRCSAASIVKYNATAGQTSLGVHRDGPLIAVTIPLNPLTDYDGGGTYIEALNIEATTGGVLKLNTGHVIMHPAMLRHGGATITRGLRYIMVVWIFSQKYIPHYHYSLLRANGFLAASLKIVDKESWYRQQLLEAAVGAYEESIELDAGSHTESAHLGLAQTLLELGHTERAMGLIDATLQRSPRNLLAQETRLRGSRMKK